MIGANSASGNQALVRMCRWHPNVGDRHVGRVNPHLRKQLVAVARLADDVYTRVLEHSDEALAREQHVLSYDDAHGISNRRPSGLESATPPRATTRSTSAIGGRRE